MIVVDTVHRFRTGHPLAFAGRIAVAKAKAEIDRATAADEFAGIDQDMLKWVYLQVSVAGGREVGEAVRAMADGMLYDYARFAEKNPVAVPAFADAARRWPSLATADADDGTADFMVRYYEHLKAGQTYAQALRNARRDAIEGRIPSAGDPLVWAAFVLFEN